MKVVLIHGIHEPEGASNMSVLWPWLQRHMPTTEVALHSYGFMGFWKARWDNDRQARRLADVVDPGDVVVTHSNGAAITYLAVRDYGMRPAGVININPALDRWRTARVEWVETIHSKSDRAVWLSQWLPGHIWGDQGRVGYRGTYDNTLNHDAGKFDADMAYEGHSGLFHHSRVDRWGAFIAFRIEERLEAAEHWRRESARLRRMIETAHQEVA